MPAGWFQDEFSSAFAPQRIQGINWASPLAEGLVFAAARREGGDLIDVAGGLRMTNSETSAAIEPRTQSMVSVSNVDGAGHSCSAPSYLELSGQASILFGGRFLADPDSYVHYFGVKSPGTQNNYSLNNDHNGGNVAMRLYYKGSHSTFSPNQTEVLDYNIYSASMGWQHYRIYQNGELKLNSAVSTGFSPSYTSPEVVFNTRSTKNARLQYTHGLIFNKKLSAEHHAALGSPRHRWDIFNQDSRYISLPAGGGGYTATMAAAMAALDASLAARVGRKAIIEGATAGVDVSGTLLADVHRTGVLVAGAAASAVKFADLTRTGPLQASVTLSADLQAKAHRKATLTGATAETASLTGNIVMPSWTLNSIDSTHHVTDGPRINAAILDYASGSSYIVIEGAGRQLKSSYEGYAAQARSTIEIPANKLLYAELTEPDTSTTGAGFGLVPTSYVFTYLNYYWVVSAHGVAYKFDGAVYRNNSSIQTYTAPGTNDVLQLAFNESTNKLWFGLNGTFNGDPAAGTGEAATMTSGPWSVALATGNSTPIVGIVNFGQRDWAHTPPSGFSGLGDF